MCLLAVGMAALVSTQSIDLGVLSERVAHATLDRFADKKLKPDELGICISELNPAESTYRMGGYRSDDEMYPASVVKLFYLTYLCHQLETRKLKMSPEIERAATDMIVESDNDATNWILEVLTGATSGPELGPKALDAWKAKRQAVNNWFKAQGFAKINASQKTWYSGPYGRERQGYGANWEGRNSLTPAMCARLMSEIMLDKASTATRCEWMRKLLHRELPSEVKEPNSQASGFIGKILPTGWSLWSKAGWTDTVRHDIAAVKAPDGREFVLVVFTKAHSGEPSIIQFAGRELLQGLGYTPLPE